MRDSTIIIVALILAFLLFSNKGSSLRSDTKRGTEPITPPPVVPQPKVSTTQEKVSNWWEGFNKFVSNVLSDNSLWENIKTITTNVNKPKN